MVVIVRVCIRFAKLLNSKMGRQPPFWHQVGRYSVIHKFQNTEARCTVCCVCYDHMPSLAFYPGNASLLSHTSLTDAVDGSTFMSRPSWTYGTFFYSHLSLLPHTPNLCPDTLKDSIQEDPMYWRMVGDEYEPSDDEDEEEGADESGEEEGEGTDINRTGSSFPESFTIGELVTAMDTANK